MGSGPTFMPIVTVSAPSQPAIQPPRKQIYEKLINAHPAINDKAFGCKGAIICVDFLGSQPHCMFCRFINQTLWSKIVEVIRDTVIKLGFKLVEVIDCWDVNT